MKNMKQICYRNKHVFKCCVADSNQCGSLCVLLFTDAVSVVMIDNRYSFDMH